MHRLGIAGFALLLLAVIMINPPSVNASSIQSTSLSNSPANQNLGNNASLPTSPRVYFWVFGYVGNTFYPQTELNISQSTMINTAKNLSETFGKGRVVLLTAVDEIPEPGGNINKSMVPTIRTYVKTLKQYAGAVWGRLDFYQFNLTESSFGNCIPWYNCPIYNQSRLMIDKLGLDGIWFDQASAFNNAVGNVTFNWVMQNLTKMFPSAKFIINETAGTKLGYVSELRNHGFTWENETYASPSPPQKSLKLSQTQTQIVYNLFPGHLIAHLDAEGPPIIGSNPDEPMSIFADISNKREFSTLATLVYNGTHPQYANESYSMVCPLIGSWTFNGTAYHTHGRDYKGTLYNALPTGIFARRALKGFIKIMENDSALNAKNSFSSSIGNANPGSNYFNPIPQANITLENKAICEKVPCRFWNFMTI